jgi:hypothetical protein
MKNFYIGLFASLLLASSTQAQENKNSFVGFSIGASTPVGAFAKSDPGTFNHWNNTSGFAKQGFTAGFDGAWYFLPWLGIGGSLYYSEHGGFSSSDARKLATSYTEAFGVDQSTVATSGRYRSGNVMVGPYFSFPFHRVTFQVRLLAGVIKSFSTPRMDVVLEDSGNSFPFSQTSSTASAFGWQTGIGLRYGLSPKFGVAFNVDYFNSPGVRIDNVNRTNSAGRLVTRQPMAWLNSSLGVTYTLW